MTRAEYEAKYGTAPAVATSTPIKMTRAEYEAKYGNKPAYNVPEIPGAKANRVAEENARLATEAKQANSPLGFATNFGKALVSNLVPSEVGLGKSLQKIYGNQGATYSKQIEQLSGTQQSTAKAIREKEARGEDATKLKQIYNDNATMLRQLQGNLKDETTLPTTGQVSGQLAGTALDLLTAGTYGKATQGMQAGKLAVQGKTSLAVANTTKLPANLVPQATSKVPAIATASGIPELAQIARQKSAGLLTKQGLGNVAVGGGIGYGYDVTQGLQGNRGQDRTGGNAFIPGVGTALGAGIPIVAGSVQSIKNARDPVLQADKLIQQRQRELAKLDSYQTLKNATEKGRARGIDVQKVLSETDVLHGSVDKTGTITTKGDGGAVEQYTKQFIDGNESIVSDALKKEGATYPLAKIKERLLAAVDKAGLEGEALVKAKSAVEREVRGYALRADAAGNVPLSVVHDAKINKYNNINFFASGNSKTYDKTVARTLKDIVEETSQAIDVKEVNAELAKHFAVIDYLNKLDGKKVDGGKLGKYFASTIGSIVGSHFGPLGAIGGAELGGRVKGNIMSRVFSGKTGRVQPQAEAITQAKTFIEKPQLALPPASEGAPRSWIGSGPTIPMAPAGTTEYVGTGKALGTYVPTQKPGTQSVLPVKTQLALPAVGESPIRLPAKNPAPVLNQAEIDAKYGQSKSNSLGSRQIAQTTTSAPIRNPMGTNVAPIAKSVKSGMGIDPLTAEARKYGSAEEFVSAQPTLYHGSDKPIEGTPRLNTTEATRDMMGNAFYTTDSPTHGYFYAKRKSGNTVSILKVRPGSNIVEFDGKIDSIVSQKVEMPPYVKTYRDAYNYLKVDKKITDPNKVFAENGIDGFTQKLSEYDPSSSLLKTHGDSVYTAIINPDALKTKSQLIDIFNKANNK